MKTTPDERKKLRVLAGIASEKSRQDAVILRLLDDIEELMEAQAGEDTRPAGREEMAARMLTGMCREGICPMHGVLKNCPHGSTCSRVTVAEWRRWMEGKE